MDRAGPSNRTINRTKQQSNIAVNSLDIPNVPTIENVDEISVVKELEDADVPSTPKNLVFPSDTEENTVETTEAYKDSREYKSIIKSVAITFLVLFLIPGFYFVTHRTIKRHNEATIVDIIILITYSIIIKLFRNLFVIISSKLYAQVR